MPGNMDVGYIYMADIHVCICVFFPIHNYNKVEFIDKAQDLTVITNSYMNMPFLNCQEVHGIYSVYTLGRGDSHPRGQMRWWEISSCCSKLLKTWWFLGFSTNISRRHLTMGNGSQGNQKRGWRVITMLSSCSAAVCVHLLLKLSPGLFSKNSFSLLEAHLPAFCASPLVLSQESWKSHGAWQWKTPSQRAKAIHKCLILLGG